MAVVPHATVSAVEVLPDDAHNARLLAHAHPRNWRNPVPRNPYNLVVVGAGPAGLIAAAGAAGLGSVFDAGGTFSLRGVLTPQIVTALVGLAVLAMVPIVYKNIMAQRGARRGAPESRVS